MLEALNEEDASPVQLARRFGEGVNLVAYHMRILADIGAVELVRTEPRRGSTEHFYRATKRPYFADGSGRGSPLRRVARARSRGGEGPPGHASRQEKRDRQRD